MLAALSNRRFVAYLSAAACADSGYWIALVAQGWLVSGLTNSPFWLGAVSAGAQLPFLLFSLVGGDLADRFDRRVVIALNNTAMSIVSLVTALLVATGAISVWWLLGLGFAGGTLVALEHPVDRAWLYDLVPRKDLGRSIGLSSLEWALARTAGPALGGAAIGALGVACGYVLYALLTVPIVVVALVLRSSTTPNVKAASDRRSIDGGMRHIVVFSLYVGTFTAGITPYIVLLPDIARNSFGADARTYGLMAAAGGVGAIAGGLTLSLAGAVRGKGRFVPIVSFAGATLLFVFAHVHILWQAVVLLGCMGFVDTVMYALANTYVQECSPDAQRGRANAIFSLSFLGGAPVGALVLGSLAAHLGTGGALSASSTIVAAAAIAFWFGAPLAREAA